MIHGTSSMNLISLVKVNSKLRKWDSHNLCIVSVLLLVLGLCSVTSIIVDDLQLTIPRWSKIIPELHLLSKFPKLFPYNSCKPILFTLMIVVILFEHPYAVIYIYVYTLVSITVMGMLIIRLLQKFYQPTGDEELSSQITILV